MPSRLVGRTGRHPADWVIAYVAIIHAAWALMIPLWPESNLATPIAGFLSLHLGDAQTISLLLLISAGLAVLGLAPRLRGTWTGVLLIAPQQAALFVTMFGGLAAVLGQHYADGAPRPWPFILADQLPAILLAVVHAVAIGGYQYDSWRACRLVEDPARA